MQISRNGINKWKRGEGRNDEWLIKEALPHRAPLRVQHENVRFAACIVANLDALFQILLLFIPVCLFYIFVSSTI